jgi:hypothetical protein
VIHNRKTKYEDLWLNIQCRAQEQDDEGEETETEAELSAVLDEITDPGALANLELTIN